MTKNKTLVCYVETDNHDGKDEKILYSLNRLNIPVVTFGKNEIWNGTFYTRFFLTMKLEHLCVNIMHV